MIFFHRLTDSNHLHPSIINVIIGRCIKGKTCVHKFLQISEGRAMGFFEKLERKFGRYAIRNLMMYLTVLYSIGFAISLVNIEIYYNYMSLDIPKILSGQVWRLVTWIMYAPSQSIFFSAIMLVLYYSLGSNLERVWGSFRFNVYRFMGYIFLIIGAFILYFIYGEASSIYPLTPDSLNLSIFLAFALTYPEMTFYIYFVLPVKAKYLAAVYLLIEIYNFIMGGIITKTSIGLSLLNFAIFYLLTRNWYRVSPKNVVRQVKFKRAVKMRPASEPIHRCAVCGRTEKDDDTLEFRYCSKCNGNLEYCSEHLYTHIHVE